jgi:hypothetical protein
VYSFTHSQPWHKVEISSQLQAPQKITPSTHLIVARIVGGTQSQSKRGGEEEKPLLLPGIETRPYGSYHNHRENE